MALERSVASGLKRVRAGLAESPIAYRLAKGALWSLVGGVASRAFTILSSIIVARIIGREGFGRFGLVQSTIGMFGILAGFGLGSTATKYIAEFREKDPVRAGSISNLTIGVSLASSGLLMGICLLISPWLASETLHDPGMSNLLQAGAPLLFFSTMNGVLLGVLSGFEAFRRIARINLLQGAAAPLIAVPLAWRFGVDGAVGSATVNAGIGCLLCAATLREQYARWGIPKRIGRACLREWPVLWKYSFPAMLSGLLVAPVVWVTNLILVNQPDGIGELGLFNAANQWRMFILFLPGMLASAMLPVLAETHGNSNRTDFIGTVSLNIRATWIVCLPLTMLVIVMGKALAGLFGREFHGTQPLITLLMLAAFLAVVNNAAASALAGSGRMWVGTALNGFWATALLSCASVLIPSRGAMGLALAYLLAYGFHTASVMLYIELRLAPSAIRSRWKLILGSLLLLGLGTHAVLTEIGNIVYAGLLLTLSMIPGLAWFRQAYRNMARA